MRTILILAAILVLLPFVRKLLGAAIGSAVGRLFAKAVGGEALSHQPDTIHLSPAGTQPWNDASAASAISDPLLGRGFEDAGTFKIQEMPVVLRLLAHPGDSLIAAIYEHPQAGVWCDMVARYEQGNSITFTTAKPSGLDHRPGHPTVNAPGLSPLALLARIRAERPQGLLKPATAEMAARVFEESYDESMAWRNHRGVSAREVAEVAGKMAA